MRSLDADLNDAMKQLEIETVGFPTVHANHRGSLVAPDERKGHHESPSRFSTITKTLAECLPLGHHGNLGRMQT